MSNKENRGILLKSKKQFIIKFIYSVILVVLLLIIPLFYGYSIDNITNGNYQKAFVMMFIFGILFIVYRLIEMLNQKAFYKLYASLYKSYMNIGLLKTCYNSLYSLSRFSLSEYSNIMSEDFELLSEFYGTLVIRIVELLQFIYIIIYFFTINITIGLITLISSIINILFLLYFNNKVSKTNEIRKSKNDQRISLFQEIFLSLKEIKGFNIFNVIRNRCNENVEDYVKWNNKLNVDKYNLRQISLGLVDIFKVICLIIGINLIMNGYMTLGMITIIYSYFTKLSELFTSIITLMEGLINVKVARIRIYKLFQYASNRAGDGLNTNIIGNIEFDNIVYGNIKNPILNEVSFRINTNTLTILTGNKKNCQSIFDLMLLYNSFISGNIYIDNVSINNFNNNDISNTIGFIMEYPAFFNTSIRNNLIIFDSNFENIINICKELDIHNYIMGLKDGYETMLSNNAINIDVDVKYLLALARVILRKNKIILIDEIFDKVSNEIRKKILDIIKNIRHEHTIILISRDRKILNDDYIDQIIVFSKGKVLGIGEYGEVTKISAIREILKKI